MDPLMTCGWCKASLILSDILSHKCFQNHKNVHIDSKSFCYPQDENGTVFYYNSNENYYAIEVDQFLRPINPMHEVEENNDVLNQEDQNISKNLNPNSKSKTKTKKKSSPSKPRPISFIWQHAEKTEDKKILICKHCQKQIKGSGNTTNMFKHLKVIHKISNTNTNDSIDTGYLPDENQFINNSDGTACEFERKGSLIWEHAEKTSDKNILICKHCQKQIKAGGNTTNMLTHLKRKHPSVIININTNKSNDTDHFEDINEYTNNSDDDIEAQNKSKNLNSKTKTKSSIIWQHAERTEDINTLLCKHCQKPIKGGKNTTNMLKHLKHKHPWALSNTSCNTDSESKDSKKKKSEFVKKSRTSKVDYTEDMSEHNSDNEDGNEFEKKNDSSFSQEDQDSKDLKSKTKTKSSLIWEHAERTEDWNILVCKHCQKQIKGGGNTTNMLKHLRHKHPSVLSITNSNTSNKSTDLRRRESRNLSKSQTNRLDHHEDMNDYYSDDEDNTSEFEIRYDRSLSRKNALQRDTRNYKDLKSSTPKSNKNSGNTTNILQHLKRKHPLIISNSNSCNFNKPNSVKRFKSENINQYLVQENVGGIVPNFEKSLCFEEKECQDEEITNAVIYMICKDLLPICTIEQEGFLQFLKFLRPFYVPPSTNTVARRIETKYEELKKNFIKDLEKKTHYCLTCNIWNDSFSQSYLRISIHYLDENFNMKTKLIGCIPLYDECTSENIKECLKSTLDSFNIDLEKITAVVTSENFAVTEAITEFIGTDRHLSSIVDIFEQVLPDTLNHFPTLNSLINKIKIIVMMIKSNISALNKLKEEQLKDGKTEDTVLKLIQDVPTYWISKIDMIERYIQLEPYISSSLAACDRSVEMIDQHELADLSLMNCIKDILPLMNCIKEVIVDISEDTYPTCSVIIPIIYCINKKIQSIVPSTEVGEEFKLKMQSVMSEKFGGIEKLPILAQSTILDPRFKKYHFYNDSNVCTALNGIKAELANYSHIEKNQDQSQTKKNSLENLWDFHDSIVDNASDPLKIDNENVELDNYIKMPLIHRKENAFKYWKNAESIFPHLSTLALRQLSVIATCVPYEEKLSSKGSIYESDYKTCLTGEDLNTLMFLSSFSYDEFNNV